ncbi:hypothetical protein OS493_037083 [Desmophyllum pertusum]|uniref:Uncharacterized protein n=1 Tax=Desmophyllum pertusum TaxID=174260 RepID=A0A9X0CU28_9CNID|nr:hypothetical protein OS493_037083 [Desmophyllum pertusum]
MSMNLENTWKLKNITTTQVQGNSSDFLLPKEEIAKELPLMTEIEQEERATCRGTVGSRDSGFSWEYLYCSRLYKLYKFDIIKDLVF